MRGGPYTSTSWAYLSVPATGQLPVCTRAFANLHPPEWMRKIIGDPIGRYVFAFDSPHGLKETLAFEDQRPLAAFSFLSVTAWMTGFIHP